MNRGRVIDKIIAVLAGIVIWAYVISVQDPVSTETIKAVPVQLTNIEAMEHAGLAISGTGEYTVDVVISGSRSKVSDAKASDFIASADVSGLTVGQNYITVTVEAPGNITISEIRTQKIQVYVDNAISIEKNISLSYVNIPEGRELGSITLDAGTVNVSGAQNLVNNVAAVKAVIDGETMDLDQPKEMWIDLVPVDADGNKVVGVRMSKNSLKVKACLYSTKEVALNVPFEGELNEHISIRSEIVPASVIIKGPADILEEIWQIDAKAIDKSMITESGFIPIDLILPEGVETADVSKNISVDYELKGRVEGTVKPDPGNIVFVNLPEGSNAEISGDIPEFALSVYEDEEELLAGKSLFITIDLNAVAFGEYDFPYELSFDDRLEDVIILQAPELIRVVIDRGTDQL